jgi:hypothetical protein
MLNSQVLPTSLETPRLLGETPQKYFKNCCMCHRKGKTVKIRQYSGLNYYCGRCYSDIFRISESDSLLTCCVCRESNRSVKPRENLTHDYCWKCYNNLQKRLLG